MPSSRQHQVESMKGSGNPYKDLHTWMDAPSKKYGKKHRKLRHDERSAKYVRKHWGDKGLKEFFRHIKTDLKIIDEDNNSIISYLCTKCGNYTMPGTALCSECLKRYRK